MRTFRAPDCAQHEPRQRVPVQRVFTQRKSACAPRMRALPERVGRAGVFRHARATHAPHAAPLQAWRGGFQKMPTVLVIECDKIRTWKL